MRFALFATLLLAPALARAAADCDDDFTECKDDCVLEHGGSIKVEEKKLYEKCMKKCTKTHKVCTERVAETKNNHLDEGSLDHSPGSDDVDSHGMPNNTSSRGNGNGRRRPTSEPGGDEDNTPAPRHDDLSDAEVPKSNRTSLRSEDDTPAPPPPSNNNRSNSSSGSNSRTTPPPKKDEPPPPPPKKEEEPPPPKKEEPIRLEPKKSVEDDDLRDDRPQKRDDKPSAPPPRREEKRDDKPRPPPKKDDDDDLRNF